MNMPARHVCWTLEGMLDLQESDEEETPTHPETRIVQKRWMPPLLRNAMWTALAGVPILGPTLPTQDISDDPMFYFQMFLYRIQKISRFQTYIQDAVGKGQKLVRAIYPSHPIPTERTQQLRASPSPQVARCDLGTIKSWGAWPDTLALWHWTVPFLSPCLIFFMHKVKVVWAWVLA